MSRTARRNLKTPFFHVMTQGINKSYIFEKIDEIKYYVKTMNKLKEKYNVKIISYCIMNNHVHLLLNVEKITELSKFMQTLNSKYAKFYNKKYNRVGYVFRDRFKSEGIFTEKHLLNCISYIYNNPVKAGICKRPEEYPFSNYKENNYKIQEVDTKYDFIDVEEERKSIKEVLDDYIGDKLIEDVVKNKVELKKIVQYLKKEKNISFRKIEKEIGIGRETLRKLIK